MTADRIPLRLLVLRAVGRGTEDGLRVRVALLWVALRQGAWR